MNKQPLTFSPIEHSFILAWSNIVGCDDDDMYFLVPQMNIGPYRVDFCHVHTRTVVEVDGRDYHTTYDQTEHDLIRQGWLEEHGYTVLRFSGSYIYHHPNLCAQVVYQHITSIMEREHLIEHSNI